MPGSVEEGHGRQQRESGAEQQGTDHGNDMGDDATAVVGGHVGGAGEDVLGARGGGAVAVSDHPTRIRPSQETIEVVTTTKY